VRGIIMMDKWQSDKHWERYREDNDNFMELKKVNSLVKLVVYDLKKQLISLTKMHY
jgi:hypothetical protein